MSCNTLIIFAASKAYEKINLCDFGIFGTNFINFTNHYLLMLYQPNLQHFSLNNGICRNRYNSKFSVVIDSPSNVYVFIVCHYSLWENKLLKINTLPLQIRISKFIFLLPSTEKSALRPNNNLSRGNSFLGNISFIDFTMADYSSSSSRKFTNLDIYRRAFNLI